MGTLSLSSEVVRRADVGERHKSKHVPMHKRFVAWDGEGYTLPNGRHVYGLFGSSDGARVSGNLSWSECLPLLMESDPNAIHVIFAGVYDLVMMIRDSEHAARILKGERTYLGKYRVHYLRGKFLRIWDTEAETTRTLYDVFSFFGCSFVRACREYLGESDALDAIERMKAERSNFTSITDDVSGYMAQELTYLVRLCSKLREHLLSVGIKPRGWHGPGAVAESIYRRHNIKTAKGTYDHAVMVAAESAYYGGRFEQHKRGVYVGDVWEYDIRSAYPSAMLALPDLSQMRWYKVRKPQRIQPFALYHVRGISTSKVGPLPWRRADGSIFYRPEISGWYWGVEIPNNLVSCIVEGYEPDGPGMEAQPFAFVSNMYAERARLKREGNPAQLALKLGLNSLYGKLAQSKGARENEDGTWRKPTFHEIMFAGYITASTRARIRHAMELAGDDLIAVETDAVFTTKPLPSLPVSSKLGAWDEMKFDGIIYLQSGVHLTLEHGEWSVKSRGFSPRGHTADLWRDYLANLPGEETGLSVRHYRFGTDPRQATFGAWYETEHRLTLDKQESKRIHDMETCESCAQGLGYADGLHPLIVPPLKRGPSTCYPFPWNGASNMFPDDDENPVEDMEIFL